MSLKSASAPKDLAEDIMAVILPDPVLIFEKRSSRLRFLARDHIAGPYIEAMARLAGAQRTASQAPSIGRGPALTPDLPYILCDHSYGEDLQKVSAVIAAEMQCTPLPEPSQAALSRLTAAAPAELETAAYAILTGSTGRIDLAAAPFLAAALQVYWTGLASGVQAGASERFTHNCPICNSPPVAGVVLSGRKLRFVCCSLCATQWYVPRLTCTNCGSTEGISYFAVEGDASGTKAEACSRCNTYLKLSYLENNPEAEVFADDLAALALDLLMSDRGYSRSGVNLFLLPGAPR